MNEILKQVQDDFPEWCCQYPKRHAELVSASILFFMSIS